MSTLMQYVNEAALLSEVRLFSRNVLRAHAARIDQEDQIPDEIVSGIAKRRLFVLDRCNDASSAFSDHQRWTLLLSVIEEIARVSPPIAKLVLDQNLGQLEMLRAFAKLAVWNEFGPAIQNGDMQLAFLLTEPRSGSDLDKFDCCVEHDNARGGFVVRGSKDWITGANDRRLFLLVARSSANPQAFGLFLVDKQIAKDTITIGEKKQKLGLRGLSEHRVDFHNTFIPDEHVLLQPNKSTIRQIMKHYNVKRCGQVGIALGIAKSAFSISYKYLTQRYPTANGRPVFPTAEFAFAEMYASIVATETLKDWAVAKLANGDETGTPTSVAKLSATECALSVANQAMQLCGAVGMSGALPLERLMRDARMLTVGCGTSELQKLTIAKNLPKLLAHPDFECDWPSIP